MSLYHSKKKRLLISNEICDPNQKKNILKIRLKIIFVHFLLLKRFVQVRHAFL